MLAQALQRRDRIGEGRPAQHRELEGVGGRGRPRQTELLRELEIDGFISSLERS